MLAPRAALAAVTRPVAVTLGTGEVLLRAARPADVADLVRLHERCSGATLRDRYGGSDAVPTQALLHRLVLTDVALIAVADGAVVALGNLETADADDAEAEVFVLVEDRWQGRGVGTALLRQLVGAARSLGYDEVVAVAEAEPGWIADALAKLGPTLLQRTPFGDTLVRLQTAPHHRGLVGTPAPSSVA